MLSALIQFSSILSLNTPSPLYHNKIISFFMSFQEVYKRNTDSVFVNEYCIYCHYGNYCKNSITHGLGIKKFLKQGLECSRAGQNGGLSNSGFRFFETKDIGNKRRSSRRELRYPLQTMDLKFLHKVNIFIMNTKELASVLKAEEY